MIYEIKEAILTVLKEEKEPIEPINLYHALRSTENRDEFAKALEELEREGKLVSTKKGNIMPVGKSGLKAARIISQSKSFSFARLMESGEDVYLAKENLKRAMLGDTVLLSDLREDGKGWNARVERVACKGPRLFTGTLTRYQKNFDFNADAAFRFPVRVDKKAALGAKDGDKVQALLSYGKKGGKLEARVVKIYGRGSSAKICADAIIDAAGIPTKFSKDVLNTAETLSREPISAQEREKRLDLTDALIFTIDGADAKDLDDAISIEKIENHWKLGVHIADVSHYVHGGSLVDEEAKLRGTSVYFADRVIPMLPEALSNGSCSLNAGEDKLAFSCLMEVDEDGKLDRFTFRKSVIRSKVRGVYSEVNAILEGNAGKKLLEKYALVLPSIREGRALAELLELKSRRRGTMDLQSSESRFFLDENGVCRNVAPRTQGISEKMIEQFMIMANQAAAKYAKSLQIPFVYRVHEQPDPERLNTLRELAAALGLKSRKIAEGARAADLSELLRQAEGTPAQNIINHQVLRTMAKARYEAEPLGHFGLNLEDYCHFTSPIRRYPDTAIHRILSDLVSGLPVDNLRRKYRAFAHEASSLSSMCEIRAMRAEREAEKCYMAEFMQGRLGEEFDGVISGATARGVFVELLNSVEGFVGLEAFPDCDFQFDGLTTLRDQRTGRKLTIGDPMRIQVAAADVATGRIDFLPAE